MKNKLLLLTLTFILITLNGCGNDDDPPPPPPSGNAGDGSGNGGVDGGGNGGGGGSTQTPQFLTGNASDGEIYYNNYCSHCHRSSAAGDSVSIFGARDLSVLATTNRITTDMHDIANAKYNLMGNFKAVPPQRVADLRIFLNRLSDRVDSQ